MAVNIIQICWILGLLAGHDVTSQNTRDNNGCTFFDNNNVYNIQLSRATFDQQQACESTDNLNQQLKVTETRTLEVAHEMITLQATVLRLLESKENLTRHIQRLESELEATRQALHLNYQVNTACPYGYTVRNDLHKSCYMFVGRDLTWYNAESFCQSSGGHLLAIETAEEQSFVVNKIRSDRMYPGQHFWIGGNDIAKEDDWIWAGSNNPFNFTQWLLYPSQTGPVQQPDNHQNDEHCIQLFHLHNYEWNDIYCGLQFYFICEYKLL